MNGESNVKKMEHALEALITYTWFSLCCLLFTPAPSFFLGYCKLGGKDLKHQFPEVPNLGAQNFNSVCLPVDCCIQSPKPI